jgi:hypothetical protein
MFVELKWKSTFPSAIPPPSPLFLYPIEVNITLWLDYPVIDIIDINHLSPVNPYLDIKVDLFIISISCWESWISFEIAERFYKRLLIHWYSGEKNTRFDKSSPEQSDHLKLLISNKILWSLKIGSG